MRSRTKYHLSDEKILELLKANFGKDTEAAAITELTGGMYNAVYLIDRKEGDQVVLKVGVLPDTPHLSYEQNLMRREVECMKLIRDRTDVPIPEILACDFSRTRIPGDYFFMTKLEGVPFSTVSRKMEKPQRDQVLGEMAACLARIHQIKGDYFGYPTTNREEKFSGWKEAFLHMYETLLSDARKRSYKLPYDRIKELLMRYSCYLDEIKIPALVEYDCHEGNVFVKQNEDGQWHVEGIIDFERFFWGDPIADFTGVFFLLPDVRMEPAFLSSYLKASPERSEYTQRDAVRYCLYRMYILTIMSSEVFRYGRFYAWIQRTVGKRCLIKCMDELERQGEKGRIQ